MLDEYLALGGVELGNNARAYAYAQCLPCCVGLFTPEGQACDGLHDATNPYTPAVVQNRVRTNWLDNPRMDNSTVGWSVSGTGVTQTAQPGGTLLQMANAAGSLPRALYSDLVATTPGNSWYAGLELEVPLSSNAVEVQVGIASYSGPSTPDGTVGLSSVIELQPGEYARISSPAIVTPAGSIGVRLWVNLSSVEATSELLARFGIVENSDEPGSYFDGSRLPAGADPETDFVVWTGAEDDSPSEYHFLEVVTPAASLGEPYTCENISEAPWYDPDNPFSQQFAGIYLLSVKGATDGTLTAGVTQGIDDGGVIGVGRHTTRTVRVRAMLIGCGNAAAEYGLAWLKAALDTPFCARHGDACGTSDLEFFIDCPPPITPETTTYEEDVSKYRRFLHGVGCTSAPVISEEYQTQSGAYVIIVEYILTAESPFVWGQTVPVPSTGTVLTAYDDIPYNLMRRPSGEEGDGIPAVVATQYAFNGSAEYGGGASTLPTGWGHAETAIAAGITVGKTTDIAAVGPSSSRVRLLATGPVTDGVISLYYDVALGAIPPGAKPSVSMWGAALVFAGAPTIASLSAELEWRTGGGPISTEALGTIPSDGGNISAPGLTIPPTATIARLRLKADGVTAVAADDLRIYADAFGLTVP